MRWSIGAEILTQFVDYTDRQTCVLFGDGAGAAVLGAEEGERASCRRESVSDGRYLSNFFRLVAAREDRERGDAGCRLITFSR